MSEKIFVAFCGSNCVRVQIYSQRVESSSKGKHSLLLNRIAEMSFLKSSSAFLLGVFTAITVFIVVTVVFKHSASSRVNTITIPMENFDGSQWSTPNTMAASTLASCKYGQFQSHTVRTETGETASNWLWTNDRDQVNILV